MNLSARGFLLGSIGNWIVHEGRKSFCDTAQPGVPADVSTSAASPLRQRRGSMRALGPMKQLLGVVTVLLTGCAAYRIAPENDTALKAAHISPSSKVEVVKQNESPGGFQCFEPMLFALTVGIVPIHCVDTYRASTLTSNGEQVSGTYTVTRMQGWFPLLLLPLPSWRFGFAEHPEAGVEAAIKGAPQ